LVARGRVPKHDAAGTCSPVGGALNGSPGRNSGKLRHLSEQGLAESDIQAGKLRQRVARTRGNCCKLPEFDRLQRPLWIRRVPDFHLMCGSGVPTHVAEVLTQTTRSRAQAELGTRRIARRRAPPGRISVSVGAARPGCEVGFRIGPSFDQHHPVLESRPISLGRHPRVDVFDPGHFAGG
jgi:hypothetical protein